MKPPIPTIIAGVTYASQSEAAKVFRMSPNTLRLRMLRWPEEKWTQPVHVRYQIQPIYVWDQTQPTYSYRKDAIEKFLKIYNEIGRSKAWYDQTYNIGRSPLNRMLREGTAYVLPDHTLHGIKRLLADYVAGTLPFFKTRQNRTAKDFFAYKNPRLRQSYSDVHGTRTEILKKYASDLLEWKNTKKG
jgi:hypothetical protein